MAQVKILGASGPGYDRVLTPEALKFIGALHSNFEGRRQALLARRLDRNRALDAGALPGFLPETEWIRKGTWKVAPIPADLQDRRVEITGPVDRKMVINALNSGASTYMADFEDSSAPTWKTMVEGQINIMDAVRRNISLTANGKEYKLNAKTAVLLVRPRGWHLDEAHVTVNGQVMSGSLFDFGLYFFHNVHELLRRHTGPYFYLPKMESHLEARLWNDVFVFSQYYLGVPQGTVRATVLIETILASFEMDEILYELRDHSAGLNCGRWDYIFSFIKKLKSHGEFVLPDRSEVGMTAHFMDSYVRLLIRTCHRRGIHAMGGMAAQIPVKNDKEKNDKAMGAVRADKRREATAGHDGTWVAHPALIPLAKAVFDEIMPQPNQIEYIPKAGAQVSAADLLKVPETGNITTEGLVENVNVSLVYTEAWIRGIGCIPLHHKMEDAATAEISRSQVWQWIRHRARTSDGTVITKALVKDILAKEVVKGKQMGIKNDRFEEAGKIMERILIGDDFADFITTEAYPYIVKLEAKL